MKKLILCLIAAVMACLVSGCMETWPNVDELMAPPMVNDDQADIYRILTGDGSVPDFVYPSQGDITTPVVMADYTGDGRDEAVAFCRDEASGGTAICFMRERDSIWSLENKFVNSANQLDRVIVKDMSGDGVPEVIVGWGSPRSMAATVCVYRYEKYEHSVREYPLGYSYADMTMTDFTGDGILEICTLTVYSKAEAAAVYGSGALARVYTFGGSVPYCAYSASISNDVTEYTNLIFGRIDKGKWGLVADGLAADGSQITQFLTLSSSGFDLISPMKYSAFEEEWNYFSRPADLRVTAKDVDNDGFLEFPCAEIMRGFDGDKLSEYMIRWLDYNSTDLRCETSMTTLLNYGEGYYLSVDGSLSDIVSTCYEDTGTMIVSYAEEDAEGNLHSLNSIFTLHKLQTKDMSLDQIHDRYQVVDILDDGSVLVVSYSGYYSDMRWVRDIVDSYGSIGKITY